MSDESDPTESEARQAVALAQALERGTATTDLPEDALGVAALLKYSVDGGELSADRRDALLEEVLATRPRPVPVRPHWMRWLALTATAATAGAAALALLLRSPDDAELPPPPTGLLEAQMQARHERLDGVEAQMAPYRLSVYQSLHARYE